MHRRALNLSRAERVLSMRCSVNWLSFSGVIELLLHAYCACVRASVCVCVCVCVFCSCCCCCFRVVGAVQSRIVVVCGSGGAAVATAAAVVSCCRDGTSVTRSSATKPDSYR